MSGERSLEEVLHNLLQYGDLSFRDFVELALYHPELGYYSGARSPVGKEGDFVTSPALSEVFGFALGRLSREFASRLEGGLSTVVDIGCGDGELIINVAAAVRGAAGASPADPAAPAGSYFGVDRSLARVPKGDHPATFVRSLGEVPRDGAHLVLSNELFDALPFARLVMRGEHLHELWVTERDGRLDWTEHEAEAAYDDYFAARGIVLADGQFADVSLDWEAQYGEVAEFVERGLIVTFDYGFREKQLFDPRIRRFGTAASYAQQRVTRDLLANPGRQDLTAHVNFDDLIRAGERRGFRTLFFDRQAKFLLSLGITEHPLFTPATDLEVDSLDEGVELLNLRDEARRLVLPDGIGEDIRVLVQAKGVDADGWSFQRKLF
jgi:SAM-dependent MidA family methyltransferase